jgi:hypothetical protein
VGVLSSVVSLLKVSRARNHQALSCAAYVPFIRKIRLPVVVKSAAYCSWYKRVGGFRRRRELIWLSIEEMSFFIALLTTLTCARILLT